MKKSKVMTPAAEEVDTTLSSGDFSGVDKGVVAFSGGKDSLACLLHLIELECPRDRIELWHHDVDGEGRPSLDTSGDGGLMDWPVTVVYCVAVADALFWLPPLLQLEWRDDQGLNDDDD